MTRRLRTFLCSLSLAGAACVALPPEASLDVEVVLRDLGDDVARLEVELTTGADLRVLRPVPERPETRAFFADVPTSDVKVVARAYDAAETLVATRSGTGIIGSKRALIELSLGPLPTTGCDVPGATHDENGFSCRRVLTEFAAASDVRPGRVVPLAGDVLLLGETPSVVGPPARRIMLLLEGRHPQPVFLDGLSEGIVVSPTRRAALVPSTLDDAGTSALSLVIGGEQPLVRPMSEVKAAPGGFGFIGDAVAWAISGEAPWVPATSRVVLASTTETSVSQTFAACAIGHLRGPLAAGAEGSFVAFEQDVDGTASAVVLRSDGSCVSSPDAPRAIAGSWGVSADGQLFAWAVPSSGGSTLHLASADGALAAEWSTAGSVKGTLGVDAQARVYAATDDGLLRFGPSSEKVILSTTIEAIAAFDARVVGEDSAVAVLGRDDAVSYLAPGAASFHPGVSNVSWASRTWLPDGALVLWGQAGTVPGLWWLPVDPLTSPVRTAPVEPRYLAVWQTAGEVIPLAGVSDELFDIRTRTPFINASSSATFAAGQDALVYIDPVDSRPTVLTAPAATPITLSPAPALSTGLSVDPARYWVVFENGEVATVGLPGSAQ